MTTDIRLSVNFPSHPKTLKLIRKLGDPAAPWLLVRLWIYAAQQRPDGVLRDMDAEDIEAIVGWSGDDCKFVNMLLDVGYLNQLEDGCFECHDWLEHNPWVAESENRSDEKRFTRLSQTAPAMYAELKRSGVKAMSKKEYELAKSAHHAGKKLADIVVDLADAGTMPAQCQQEVRTMLAPEPVPVPIPEPIPKPKDDDSSSQASTTPLPPATGSESSSSMSFEEFRIEFQQATGDFLPGGCNNRAHQLCRTLPREKLKSAFEVTALQGGKSMKYLESVLEGKPKPEPRGRDRPSRHEESVQRGHAEVAKAMEVIYAAEGV